MRKIDEQQEDKGGLCAAVPERVAFSVSPRALQVYVAVALEPDASKRRLVERCHCARSTIDLALAELEAEGAITIERRRADGGGHETNRYTIHLA